MARVVIELKSDISPLIPRMGKAIASCGTTKNPPRAAFRHRGYGVVVHPQEITILNAEDQAIAEEVLDVLKMVETRGNQTTKKADTA